MRGLKRLKSLLLYQFPQKNPAPVAPGTGKTCRVAAAALHFQVYISWQLVSFVVSPSREIRIVKDNSLFTL